MLENDTTENPMYTAVHYDRFNELMFLWLADGRREVKRIKHRFYTPVRGQYGAMPCGMSDIYGNEVYEVVTTSRDELDYRNRNIGPHNLLSECDIDFRTRWLQEFYKEEETLTFNINDINICYLDIEVSAVGRFPVPEKAEYPVNCVTIYFSKYKKYYTFGLNRDIGDETRKKIGAKNGEYINCKTEKELLIMLFKTISENNVDILTAYNCIYENENIWLEDKILPIKKIKIKDKLLKFGEVEHHVYTGEKTGYEIELCNGKKLTTSSKHIFPIYHKDKGKYKYFKTLEDSLKDERVCDFEKRLTDQDVFLKLEMGNNKNKTLTYRDLLKNNLEYFLQHNEFDIVINRCDLRDKLLKNDTFKKRKDIPAEVRGKDFWKRASNFWSYKNLKECLLVDDIKSLIQTEKKCCFLFGGNRKVELDLDEKISDDYLYLLGMLYTDGTWNTYDKAPCVYNTDKGIINKLIKVLNKSIRNRKINNINDIYKNKDGVYQLKFSHRTSHFGLLLPLIYSSKMNKHINVELFSLLSNDQFFSFFSGCIDGDGCISNNIITLACEKKKDRSILQDLLQWNGVFSFNNNRRLLLSKTYVNKAIYENLNLFHSKKKEKIKKIITNKNENSPSDKIKKMVGDDYVIIKIKKINKTNKCKMYDITTSSHYFIANGIKTHNCHFFDMLYLINRSAKLSVDLKLLSRLPERYKSAYISKRDNQLKIGGTELLDYLSLYRHFSRNERDNYKLDTIGEAEVGKTKEPLPDGYKSWINYWDDWVWYNFCDVELMVEIEEKCKLFETVVSACAEARVSFDSIFEPKKMLVGFILNILHKQNIVMPPLRENVRESFPGAYVYATADYYLDLVSYDFRSMYPSFIMSANISPETKVVRRDGKFYDALGNYLPNVTEKDLSRSPFKPSGDYEIFYMKGKEGIIPKVTNIIFNGRVELKNKMKAVEKAGRLNEANVYDMRQNAFKIFGNALYGLLGNPYFQFYDIDNSATVTTYGQLLIKYTCKQLCEYFESGFGVDERFKNAFGDFPKLDKSMEGTYINENGQECYHRLSHGDTDSFFVKYSDIFAPYKDKKGKEVEVLAFSGNQIISKNVYDVNDVVDDVRASKLDFHKSCLKYCPSWAELPNEKKKKAFDEGIFMEGNHRVIYNRYTLTDFCRIVDAVLMEDVLAKIMDDYAKQWNLRDDVLFLKREKCVTQAIVTRRKKYICKVESNEDVKIFDEKKKLKFTGIEAIRSDSTPFTRKHLLTLIDNLLESNMNKKLIKDEYLQIKTDFFDLIEQKKIYDISIPSGISKDPPEYDEYCIMDDKDRKAVDWRLRAGTVWNHLIETDDVLKELMLEPIYQQAKVKFIKVTPNKYGLKSIAYIGNECPEYLLEIFNPDWNGQWKRTFGNVMDRLFVAIGWGKDFENDQTDLMLEIF